ncbi:hypothetical protein [Bergeyella zoohelcum]|uniref:Transferrin-binding protein B C-lobe/N-lobe beta barrel domain-containing protein n=1 Tax=Bergeyella zoohelcum ATCC 43767 TaxID=883096 RepID=K1LS01_9FLAO|nr:hypothetical protein [Bergeyella zoohelcum]EKB59715.1 hypothetical protein HMPREF9699_00080 [Bergeyella zoohelcum ATCC 43767]SUV49742.1 Uncharacterised protein [Bergeyella zoohelcum]
MNKTTIKISVLAFLGFMTYGYAQQQQQDPYKGKVGINTVTPSATMDVQPNSDNARVESKTNEGIIAPKLSKTRIANIETPVEGTLVYATDATYSAGSDATVNNRVAKITEKGYYFYNGTEWVKAGSDATDQLWAQRDNGGVTETYLKPAENDGTSFTYKKSEVEITSKDSGYNNTNQGLSNFSGYGISSRRYNNIGYGPALSLVAGRGSIATPEASQVGDTLGRIYFNPTPSVSTANAGYGVSIVSKLVEKQNDTSYATSLEIGVRNIGESYPVGAIHISPNRNVGIGKIADGFRLDVHGGVRSHGIEIKSQGNIGPSFSIRNDSKDKPHQANKWVLYNMTDADPNTPGGYNDGLVFWSYNSDDSAGGPKLMLTDSGSLIVGAKYTYINTSLPTEKLVVDGNAKIQSLSGTGDRVVVADQDGVLKTSQFVMKATDTTDGCSASNAGAIHYKEIDKGGKMVGVFGFCTRDTQGNYKWAYNMGGANMLDGTGAFGSGL